MQLLCKVGLLREKAVARVHRIRSTFANSAEQRISVQIGVRRGRCADMHRLTGQFTVQCSCIGIRIDGDGLHIQAGGGFENTAGDLAPIGDQQLFDAHSGILPYFFGGKPWRLSRNSRSA